MGSRHFSLTELAALVHERHPPPPDSGGARFTLPYIIKDLLEMAQNTNFLVSFVRNSDTIFEHYLPNRRPYQSAEDAAVAAERHDDLQDKHYTIVRCGDGWGIRNVTAGHDAWRYYWDEKDELRNDGRTIPDDELSLFAASMLVSQDEWTGFVNSGIYRAWIKDNAPLTEEPVVRYWPIDGGSSEADPYRTGGQGRPTMKHFILAESERRIGKNLEKPKLTAEAQFLAKWARDKHPEGSPPTARTIENMIREQYQDRPKNPTK